ncbi:hypothetical protein ACWCP6_28360 [Streptomyces sp. NPDC002004]
MMEQPAEGGTRNDSMRHMKWWLLASALLASLGLFTQFYVVHKLDAKNISLSQRDVKVGANSLENQWAAMFTLPKGYTELTVAFDLGGQLEYCVRPRVAIYGISGTSSRFSAFANNSSFVLDVPIRASATRVELAVALEDVQGNPECRGELQVEPYSVSSEDSPWRRPVDWSSTVLLFLSLACIVFPYLSRRLSEGDWEARERLREAERGLEESLRQSGDTNEVETEKRLLLSDLWTVTHRRLDHYHGIATNQASRSFRNAQGAMGTGFVLLIGFTLLAMTARTATASIVAGTLGVTSAALAGYVGRTFVRSREASASHLRAYFNQPLEFSRYLAAERLISEAQLTNEARAEILASLVQAMVTPPPALADPPSVNAEGPRS